MTSLRFLTFTFWNYYVLKLLRFETITFSDDTLSDINVVLCYVFSQYQLFNVYIKYGVKLFLQLLPACKLELMCTFTVSGVAQV